jgi:hypothetical protein
MLELVRSNAPRYSPRYEPAWDDLDEAHAAVWDAIRPLFPPQAMADQTDYGVLVVSWQIRGRRSSHFAAPVIVRIDPGLLVALWTCDEESRREIAMLQVDAVREALDGYDPHSRIPTCGVVQLGE